MASGTWAVDANGNWSLATNWASSVIADGASDAANFTNNITAARTVTIDTTSRTIGTVNLADSTATFFGWTLAASGGAGLTLDNGASAPTITVNNAASTISAPLSGTNGFTKLGTQALTLTGTNPVSGTITVSAGTLTAGANDTIGDFGAAANSIVVSSGATASVNRSNAYTIDGSITGAGTFSKVTGTGTLTLTNGTISVSTMTLSAGTTEFSNAGAQNVSSVIGGAGAITKSLGGTLTLSGGGTNTGAWAVNAGTLAITTAAQTGATGAITVASGATLTSTAAIGKPITVLSGGNAILSANTSGSNYFNGSGVSFTGTTTHSGLVSVGNVAGISQITFPANTTLSSTATFGANATAYTSAQFAGTSIGGNVTVGSIANSTAYSYVSATAGSFGGIWYIGFGPGGSLIGPAVVDINGAVFNNAGLGASTVHVGSTITGQAVLNVLAGSHSVAATEIGYSSATSGSYQHIVTLDNSTWTANGLLMRAASATARSILNVNNGALAAFAATTLNGTTPKDLNLWGGTFRLLGNWAASSGGASRIALFGSGNKFSVQGASSFTLSYDIKNPAGSGVTSIPLTSGGSGYIGAPAVRITGGGGTGATARAVVDLTVGSPTYGQVTNIVITNPGENYTSAPTVNLDMAGGYTVAAVVGTPTIGAGSNDGAIEKVDTGTLALLGTNTNTGTYTVSAGTLRIGNAGTAGTLGNNDTSNASVASGATLAFGRSDARTYSGIISGTGTIAVNGGGRATISGVNTFTSAAAAIAISTANSALRVTNNDSIGQGTTFGITVASGTAFEIDGTSGNLTGLPAKALSLNGTGISAGGALRNIAGSNTYPGTITLAAASRINSDAGTLSLTSASAITGNTFGLTFGGAGDISVTPAINTTTGVVIKDGSGFANLAATNSTYTGKTTVSAGTLGYASIAGSGVASSFGAPTVAASLIVDVAGAASAATCGGIRFTGSSPQTFSRTINITGATAGFVARFESSGSAAVTHSTAFTNTTTNQTRTYQFGGTGTAANTVSFLVANNGTGAVSITKADAGKWVLPNTSNSYTGATTVNGGTLVLSVATWAAGAKVTSTSTVTVNASAKIQTLTGSGSLAQKGRHTYSNLTFAANGRIRIGGALPVGVLTLNSNLTISGNTTWNFADPGYNDPGTYTVVQFALGASLVGGQTTLDNYVIPSVIVPAGRTLTSLTYIPEAGSVPAYIQLVLA